MVAHMKTTIEIAKALFERARKTAASERTTLRALVEEGLRLALDRRVRGAFRLRRATFRGQGLGPELRDASWDRVREMAYEGRGG